MLKFCSQIDFHSKNVSSNDKHHVRIISLTLVFYVRSFSFSKNCQQSYFIYEVICVELIEDIAFKTTLGIGFYSAGKSKKNGF